MATAGCLGVVAFVAAPAGSAMAASTVDFCYPTMYGTYGGYTGVCSRQAQFSVNWIDIQLSGAQSSECVYLGTNNNATPPMSGGNEWCTTASQSYIYQGFSGGYGNPAVHNRHSYDVPAAPRYNRA